MWACACAALLAGLLMRPRRTQVLNDPPVLDDDLLEQSLWLDDHSIAPSESFSNIQAAADGDLLFLCETPPLTPVYTVKGAEADLSNFLRSTTSTKGIPPRPELMYATVKSMPFFSLRSSVGLTRSAIMSTALGKSSNKHGLLEPASGGEASSESGLDEELASLFHAAHNYSENNTTNHLGAMEKDDDNNNLMHSSGSDDEEEEEDDDDDTDVEEAMAQIFGDHVRGGSTAGRPKTSSPRKRSLLGGAASDAESSKKQRIEGTGNAEGDAAIEVSQVRSIKRSFVESYTPSIDGVDNMEEEEEEAVNVDMETIPKPVSPKRKPTSDPNDEPSQPTTQQEPDPVPVPVPKRRKTGSAKKRTTADPAFVASSENSDSDQAATVEKADANSEKEQVPRERKTTKARVRFGGDDTYMPPADLVQKKHLPHRVVAADAVEGDLSDDEKDIEANRISNAEKSRFVYDHAEDKAQRLAMAGHAPEDLTPEERELYYQFVMRGFEPVLPNGWELDFNTLPPTVFGPKPLIHPIEGSNFYAIKSLANLLHLGGRVRDCQYLTVPKETVIVRGLRRYIDWALYDANLRACAKSFPVYAISARKPAEKLTRTVNRLNRRLEKLALRYRQAASAAGQQQQQQQQQQQRYPILVGFLVTGPLLSVVTLDTNPNPNPNPNLGRSKKKERSDDDDGVDDGSNMNMITTFDMSEWGQEGWNALGIAIAVNHIRRTMAKIKEEKSRNLWAIREDATGDEDEDR